jgi:hypothetical protein
MIRCPNCLPCVQDYPCSSRFVLGDRLVATLAFFISSFSAELASYFTGPVISVLDGGIIEICHNHSTPSAST